MASADFATMEDYDGIVSYFPTAKYLLNESYSGENELLRVPTTETIIVGTLFNPNRMGGIVPIVSALNLYGNGCKAKNGNINCTEACGHRRLLFQDWQTQWNCLTLTTMAMNKPAPHNFSHLNVTGDTRRTLDHLGVANLSAFDGQGVLQKYIHCYNASCNLGEKCYIEWSGYLGADGRISTHSMGGVLIRQCSKEMSINPDLAGPGVLFSYMLSTIIVLYAWFCIRSLRIASTIDWFARFTRYRGKVNAFITFHRSRLALRFEHSTSTFVAEMQEAQCFFVFAIQVSLIYAYSQPPDFWGADTWQDLTYVRSITKELVVVSVIPILLNQIILYKVRLDSIYTLSLCTVVFIMAYVASLASIAKDFDRVYELLKLSKGLLECGGMPSLDSVCSQNAESGLRQPRFLMKSSFATLSLLWFKKLWREFAGSQWLNNYARRLSKNMDVVSFYAMQLGLLSATVMIFVSEIMFVSFMAMNLNPLYQLFSLGYPAILGMSPATWSVGQVISVMVWAPVGIKYFYLLFFGVEKGFGIRVSTAFAIIRKPRDSSRQESEDGESLQSFAL